MYPVRTFPTWCKSPVNLSLSYWFRKGKSIKLAEEWLLSIKRALANKVSLRKKRHYFVTYLLPEGYKNKALRPIPFTLQQLKVEIY